MACKFCQYDPAIHHKTRYLYVSYCSEHDVPFCPNCGSCPTVRATKDRIARAHRRAAYKTWEAKPGIHRHKGQVIQFPTQQLAEEAL